MASCPIAKKKPEFLPEHPIVLENGVSYPQILFDFYRCVFDNKNA